MRHPTPNPMSTIPKPVKTAAGFLAAGWLLAAASLPAAEPRVFHAMGEMAGEVGTTGAILQSRLTSSAGLVEDDVEEPEENLDVLGDDAPNLLRDFLLDAIRSWVDDVVARPRNLHAITHVIPSALHHYDLPDLSAILGEKLRVE